MTAYPEACTRTSKCLKHYFFLQAPNDPLRTQVLPDPRTSNDLPWPCSDPKGFRGVPWTTQGTTIFNFRKVNFAYIEWNMFSFALDMIFRTVYRITRPITLRWFSKHTLFKLMTWKQWIFYRLLMLFNFASSNLSPNTKTRNFGTWSLKPGWGNSHGKNKRLKTFCFSNKLRFLCNIKLSQFIIFTIL